MYRILSSLLAIVILSIVSWQAFREGNYLGGALAAAGIIGLTGLIFYFINTTNRKLTYFFSALENDDYTIRFVENEGMQSERLLNHILNRIKSIIQNTRIEIQQKERYYELILNSISSGVIALDDNGFVLQLNRFALKLIDLEVFTHVSQLSRIDANLMGLFAHCRPGDKLQTRLSNERGTVNLSIRVSDITIRQEHFRILALNDINNELDEKEIDSWIRLTRVLTHEIMNSVTPITSLSDTLLTLIQGSEELKTKSESISSYKETADEIRNGLHTISTTGKGLLSFVENYRRFTRIPKPEPSLFYVKGFINRMVELARHQYPDSHITFHSHITPDDLILYADENLISQVLINLLKNAIQAIEAAEIPEGIITLHAYCNENEAVLIEVSNNGPAIPPEVAEHIFIPFFTTKEGGSGIGLSISRQIMRLSGGSLSLHPGKETMFVLKFN